MTTSLYRWTWRLDAPLFVGALPAGSLSRTRMYVPARAVWGALTAELARMESGDGAPAYETVGQQLRGETRMTYLYPAERLPFGWRAWLPQYRDAKGLVWRREDNGDERGDRRFRRLMLYTRPGAAIDPCTDAAEDGSLHETECLQMRSRNESGAACSEVGLVGYICASPKIAARLNSLSTLFLGGDTRYGLGRVSRVACAREDAVFGSNAECGDGTLRIRSKRILGHADAADGMTGAYELLSGWDMHTLSARSSFAGQLWAPGSICADETFWAITSDGTWSQAAPF